MAIKTIESFITDNNNNLGLAGVPIVNTDLGIISNDLEDLKGALAHSYGNSRRYIENLYNINDVYRGIQTSNMKPLFKDLQDELFNNINNDYSINAQSIISTGRGQAQYENFNINIRDFEVISGMDISLEYDNIDKVKVTIKKGCFGYKGRLYFMDVAQDFILDLIGTNFQYISFDVENLTLTTEARQKEDNNIVNIKKKVNGVINKTDPKYIGEDQEPIWSTKTQKVTNIPLVELNSMVMSGQLYFKMRIILENYRFTNEIYFLRRELMNQGTINYQSLI